MTNCDKAIEILSRTQDGNRLEPRDLALVELAVNGALNEAGDAAFGTLHTKVLDCRYFEETRWFHGIAHLTRNHQGYVYWKGIEVEHYSFRDTAAEREAALRLAERCLLLEHIGFAVTSRTVLSPDCYGAAVGTVWQTALSRYYAFFTKGDVVVGIFYRKTPDQSDSVFAICMHEGEVQVTEHADAYEAYHSLQNQGAVSMGPSNTFEETVSRLERLGVSAERLTAEIEGSLLH